MFCLTGKNRHWLLIAAFGQKSGGDTFAFAAMRLIANYVDDEVNRVWINPQRAGDGVEAGLQFRQQANELFGPKPNGWMLQQKINRFHSPKVNAQIVFVIGLKQVLQ